MKEILAVDDQVEILDLLTFFLSESYKIYPAKTIPRAFALLRQNKFDLILLDIMMPGMNGIEFLAFLKSQPFYEKTPIVFVSSESDSDIIRQAAELGANGFIKKPIEKDVLLKKVVAIIGR
ncbi:MAG: response regulator [Spirochaetaceae bacterium]|jgi:CheY-like chemotaxis protein|nr:response regulator [Spirochaetaceae bacterium]